MKSFYNIMKTIAVSCLLIYAFGCSGGGGSTQNLSPVNPNGGTTVGSGSVVLTLAKANLVQGESTTATATFTNADGTPANGLSVSFATTLGTITSTATTGPNGTATVTLAAPSTSGQGSVTATGLINNILITKTATFTVQLPQLSLSSITVPATAIGYGASTSIEVSVLDANSALYTAQDVDVTFSSTESSLGHASINSPIRTVNGKATTTYTAITNSGSDTITASISGSSKTASISVTPLSTSSIQFVSALPAQIGLKGSNNSFPELSKVTFKVINSAGLADPNKGVTFSLDTSVGGITLSGITNTTPTTGTGSTDSQGLVSVNVQSGTIATSVSVTATVTGTSIRTQSAQLVIASGLPAQDSMSISLSDLNSESWNVDGVQVSVTARLADHFRNPVKGTAITFTTSGGSIDPTCTTDINGACTVTWRSQNPRPLAYNIVTNLGGPPLSGQVMILAHAIGEEDFLDSDGNGLAGGSCASAIVDGTGLSPIRHCGEFSDWSEAYLDQNWNGIRDSFETFYDYNQDGIFNGPNGFFTGSLQDTVSVASPRAKHIFMNTKLIMSSSAAGDISLIGSSSMARSATVSRIISISDINGNTMPSGSVITLTGTTLTVSPSSITVPQNIQGALSYSILMTNSATTAGSGAVTVNVTSPGGIQTTQTFVITW